LQNCWVQNPPIGAQMPQLALQQKAPSPQVVLPHGSGSCPRHDWTTLPPPALHRQGLQASMQRPSGYRHCVPRPQIWGQIIPGGSPPAGVVSDGE
jgi:hypothetical protein